MNKKLLAIFFIGIFCVTLVSAVWWNPWTWFNDPINNTAQEGKLFIIQSNPQWNKLKHTDETDYSGDGIPDLISNITWINETHIEIFVDDKVEKGNYKWASAICNISGVDDLLYMEEDAGGGFANANIDNLSYAYGPLIDQGYPSHWCNETGGYGFYLFGGGPGDKRYRLILPQGEKELSIYSGKGSEEVVMAYQNISTLNYNLSFALAKITLYKNISGTWDNTVNDLFVHYNNNSYKFGANDSSNNDTERYLYVFESSSPLYRNGNIIYVRNSQKITTGTGINERTYYETHDFDLRDICSREFNNGTTLANCSFNPYDIDGTYYYEVYFTSDKNIDPLITIGEDEWASVSILTNITLEGGGTNFTHLNISSTAPYDNLLGYWNFDGDIENTAATIHYDFSPNNYDSQTTGDGVSNSTGCISGYGNCLQLDGTGDYVTIFGVDDNVPLTLSAWVNSNSFSTEQAILYFGDGTASGGGADNFRIGIDTSGNPFAEAQRGSGGGRATSSVSIGTGEWHLVTGVFVSATSRQVFVDGIQRGSNIANEGVVAGKDVWKIGAYGNDNTVPFNGSIDEAIIFDINLSVTQIQGIFNNLSSRFLPMGVQDIIDQTKLNISSGNNRVNVSTTVQNNQDSIINLTVGYYDGSWSATAPQTVISNTNMTFIISGTSTNLTLNYTFVAGNSTADPFYSPILQGDIYYEAYNFGAAPDSCTYTSGNWDIDCSDDCVITSDVDMSGNNISLTGTGTFTTSANITNYGKLLIRGTDSSNICNVFCISGGCFDF